MTRVIISKKFKPSRSSVPRMMFTSRVRPQEIKARVGLCENLSRQIAADTLLINGFRFKVREFSEKTLLKFLLPPRNCTRGLATEDVKCTPRATPPPPRTTYDRVIIAFIHQFVAKLKPSI